MYMCEHACGGPVLMMGTILNCSFALFFETVSQSNLELADVVCLASQCALGIFYLCLLGLEFCLLPFIWFSGDLNSGPYTCSANTWTAEPSFEPPHLFVCFFIMCT